jgi:hypothetical protein
VHEVHQKLHAALEERKVEDAVVVQGETVKSLSVPVESTVVMSPEKVSVEAFAGNGQDLIIIEFDDQVTMCVDDLSVVLRQFLLQHGVEGVFTVKQGVISSNSIDANRQGIVWCPLQPGARGLGFWYRADQQASWEKFSLVPDSQFDLGALADELMPVSQIPKNQFEKVQDSMRGVVTDFVEDVASRNLFLTELARMMLKKSMNAVPTHELTSLFNDLMGQTYSGRAVGAVMQAWADIGYLRPVPIRQGASRLYSLGVKSADVLPEEAKGLVGKHITLPVTQPVAIPTVQPIKLMMADERTRPLAPTPAPATGSLAAALASIAQKRDHMQQIESMLLKHQEIAVEVEKIEAAIAENEAQIKALLDRRDQLRKHRDDIVADMLTPAQIEELVRS